MTCVRTKSSPMSVPGHVANRTHERSDPDEWEEGQSRNEEWLATLAHELRSPLATVLYALETIAGRQNLDWDARRACGVAERQAQRALQIADDIFDVCAGSRGKLPLRKEVVDLAEVVARAAEAVGHLLAKREHQLTVSLPPGPVTLCGDALRLEQVLTNLLANAAKFTDPGGHIRLSAEAVAGQVTVRVQDNGRGIDPDLLPRVFDLYHQGLNTGEQATSGLGIGLALVKLLVELHGGRVTAVSDGPGTGSEFVVRLPARLPVTTLADRRAGTSS